MLNFDLPCTTAQAAKALGLPHWKVCRILKALDRGTGQVLVNVSTGTRQARWLVVGGALRRIIHVPPDDNRLARTQEDDDDTPL
jgi:hypothetical protein